MGREQGAGVHTCAVLCLFLFSAPSPAPASPDPCSTGYWNGSNKDVDACAELAKAGGPNAEFRYGLILLSGHHRPEDHRAALDWFRKSARQGHYLAQTVLGHLLCDPSVEKELRNPVEAYAWWTSAGATSHAAKVLTTLSPSDASRAKQLGTEYRAKYGQRRPPSTGP